MIVRFEFLSNIPGFHIACHIIIGPPIYTEFCRLLVTLQNTNTKVMTTKSAM